MFGPSLLVAPVTEQGRISRTVYLPAGTDWYNFWTNERFHGSQTIVVDAPIDTIPLFVRAGAILPLGSPVESTNEIQDIVKLRIYPGADGQFNLYRDDGNTYAYERGEFKLTQLHWSDASAKLSHTGPQAWTGTDKAVVEVIVSQRQ